MGDNKNNGLLRFRRKGDLTGRKLIEYIPAMMVTNLSTLLLVSVDGVVAGNLVGEEALSAVSIFYPVTLLTGAASVLVASGISTSISTAMGKSDSAELDRIKGVSVRIILAMAVITAVVQIPVVLAVVRSYRLPEEIYRMTMQYAVGIMISTPLGIISCAGTYQLQIAGKMKILMRLSVIEGVANLMFDLLYTGVFGMGVAGTGYGTATANIIRCGLTVMYLYRCTDMYRGDTGKVSLSDVKSILSVEVIVRFRGRNEAVFVELDDGKCIALDKNEVSRKLITDNYELLRKLAKSVEYQYILNMNYTRFTFSGN
ncbi:MAG: hypothetical protein IKE74_08460 [Mogibacterium sp.]|nr:hypothetical protein [Mogibacterium sp.]